MEKIIDFKSDFRMNDPYSLFINSTYTVMKGKRSVTFGALVA